MLSVIYSLFVIAVLVAMCLGVASALRADSGQTAYEPLAVVGEWLNSLWDDYRPWEAWVVWVGIPLFGLVTCDHEWAVWIGSLWFALFLIVGITYRKLHSQHPSEPSDSGSGSGGHRTPADEQIR